MARRLLSAALGCSLAVGLAVTAATAPAAAKGGSPATTTADALLAQARRLEPLRALADALATQGRGTYRTTWSSVQIDADHDRVLLFATSAAAGSRQVAAAHAAVPGLDLAKVDVRVARYTKVAMDARIAAIMGRPDTVRQYALVSAAAAPDGSGVQVVSSATALAGADATTARSSVAQALSGSSGVAVSVSSGPAVSPTTWRWDDTYPLIAGDVVLGPDRKAGYLAQCTTGIAVEDSSGRDYITAAAHCFPSGSAAYGEGDAVGSFGYHYGNRYGTVGAVQAGWDTELIATGRTGGGGTNSDEADQPSGKWYAVSSEAYSYDGDYVCQDGARSYYTGHGVPCGIKVVNQDITYSLTWDDGSTHSVRGVEGTASSGYAVTQGDSGGMVFSVTSSTTRQARGSVSAESGNANLFWTETPDILHAFGVRLNPHQ